MFNVHPILFALMFSFLSARDLYVSKASLAQYEKDDYLLFDVYNDTLESSHSSHPDYYPAYDAVDLGNDGPILGSTFTQEVKIFIENKRLDPDWGHLMGYMYEDATKEAPFIWKYNGDDILYGFGSGDERNVVIVDSLIVEKGVWYHIATTFDGTNYKLYINGEEVYNYLDCAGKVPYPTPVKYIGGNRERSGRFFGRMDELRMWNYARSQDQIQEKMNKELTGNESGLVAYYPMDVHNQYLLDRSGNNYHGVMIGPVVKSRYYSNDCSEPDGTMSCPYPTLEGAFEHVKPWDRIIMRGGRYTEFIMRDGINFQGTDYTWSQLDPDFPGPRTNTITIEPYPDEKVVIDGTVSIDVDWEPYNYNGHSIFRAILDSVAIADEIQRPFRDVYGVWIDDRYQVPAVTPNIKNPTDPLSYEGLYNNNKGTFWEVDVLQSDMQFGEVREGSVMSINRENGLARLDLLDTLEEWAFDPKNEMLYIYADERYLPTSTNVRIRVLHRMLSIKYVANVEFRNIKFFGGSMDIMGQNVLFEDCEFEQLHDITLPPFRNHGPLCAGLFSWNVDFINCIFSRIPFVYSLKIGGAHSLVENCLLTNMDWWTNPGGGAPGLGNVCRFVTIENSKIGGVGGSSLMEYCRIEDYTDACDCSGINRGAHGAPRSMTRYNWVINGPGANGMRFDGGSIGAGNRRGDIHHFVTVGNNRGMRLKGDYHDVHHVTSYDNRTLDIDLFSGKYAEPRELNHGYDLGYTPGNANTEISNSLIESSFGCPLEDCWPFPESEHDWTNPTDGFHLLEKGIWFGTALGKASLHKELTNPWQRSLTYPDTLYFDGYYRPDDRTQDYDFRPRKGSTLIDAGVVIPGINDGQDLQFNWPPSFQGQNRRFVGDAPDIGAYEYGDSVYWIPGYRYPHPSFPIPRNNAVDVIPDYSVVWNYPYKRDYSSTMASVTINGPGVNRSEIFQYPNNVCFQEFQPGGNYTWSVSVDGISGGTWSFWVDNDIFPMNDRSIDTTLHEVIPLNNQKSLEVSENNIAFLLFDIPSSVDNSWDVDLNLTTEKVEQLTGGIVVYKYDHPDWGEKNDEKNIGIIDHALGIPLDTLFSLEEESVVSLDISSIINESGKYSFALGPLDSNDQVAFYSYEAGRTGEYAYFTKRELWPSLSFTPNIDSVDVVLSLPPDDSTIVLNSTSGDSILFEWGLSHSVDLDFLYYQLQVGLPIPSNTKDKDTLFINVSATENSTHISKKDLFYMLLESNLSEGEFVWDVNGVLASGEMTAVKSHSFRTVIGDPNYESNLPEKYWLYNNYPNPFNASTIISYDLKFWSWVTLEVFDILGRNVMQLEGGLMAPGKHHVQWFGKDTRGNQMPSGIYFYHIKVKDRLTGKKIFIKTEKMMIVK